MGDEGSCICCIATGGISELHGHSLARLAMKEGS